MGFVLDSEIIRGARTDPDVRERLIASVWPEAYRVAFGILADRGLAEDAPQEACATIALDIAKLRSDEAFYRWMYRIVVRRASGIARRFARLAAPSEIVSAEPFSSVAERLDVTAALATLTITQRSVVVLHYYAGHPSPAIARILQMPAPTVRFHLASGRRRIKGVTMYDFIDDRLGVGVRLRSIPVPDFNHDDIERRMAIRIQARNAGRRRARAAFAAAVVLGLLAFGTRIPVVVGDVEAGCLAALHALGVGEGLPHIASTVIDANRPVLTTLERARHHADFTLVAPSGLPSDVIGSATFIAPVLWWSNATKSWSSHGVDVVFRYRRPGERMFDIEAQRYDPRADPAPRYIYDADAACRVRR